MSVIECHRGDGCGLRAMKVCLNKRCKSTTWVETYKNQRESNPNMQKIAGACPKTGIYVGARMDMNPIRATQVLHTGEFGRWSVKPMRKQGKAVPIGVDVFTGT